MTGTIDDLYMRRVEVRGSDKMFRFVAILPAADSNGEHMIALVDHNGTFTTANMSSVTIPFLRNDMTKDDAIA